MCSAFALNCARLLSLASLLVALSATAAEAQLTAAWNPNTDALTAGYRVFVGTAQGAPVVDLDVGMATTASLPLPPGNTYYVSVRAYTVTGALGPASAEIAVDLSAPPGPPAGFHAEVSGPTATLAWSSPTWGGIPLSYVLSIGTSPGAADLLSGYPVGDARSVSGDLPPGNYFARLQAANLIGVGPASDISFQVGGGFRPQSPSGLTATWVGASVRLSWSAPSGAPPQDLPDYYVLEAGSSPGAANIVAASVGNTTTLVTEVPPGTFYVRIRGVNARGTSDPTNEIMLQGGVSAGPPRNLSASLAGNVVSLAWQPPSGGGASGYIIEAGSAPGLSDIAVANVGNVTAFMTVAPPGAYYVRVRAVGSLGVGVASNEVVVKPR